MKDREGASSGPEVSRPERAEYWFKRHGEALAAAPPGEVPRMQVTREEYGELRAAGKPWHTLDGFAAWAGVIVEVVDA